MEVFEDTQYMSGIGGARCTTELKKIPRLRFAYPEDVHCFGFAADEQKRIEQFEANNPDMNLAWPLATAGMTKAHCLKMVTDFGNRTARNVSPRLREQ